MIKIFVQIRIKNRIYCLLDNLNILNQLNNIKNWLMYCLQIQMVSLSNYSKNQRLKISSSFFVQCYFSQF